ncbi:Gfo/Idh/MocA family protein [Pontibacter sp. SGAir0037]|uniref:Gfo/Idh/MocA family protein n=1 Tax=Pontibacter sp. SGAir0037 TaxID=2571030 RepID=UPI0010CD1860|nr:Gfo/Idh/MocA family oxidoreductase [Pontibacter sp. SGAir0037]QCR22965.1 glucose-fructose oxidoreductase [Pontibacter sp. SGAir0037]
MPQSEPSKENQRRTFLLKAGYGAVAAGIASLVPSITGSEARAQNQSSGMIAPEKKVGWAIVGLGKFATQQLMPSFSQCKKSKLVALVSGDAEKAKKYATEYGIAEKNTYNYQNYDNLRNNPEVDVIYIVLPNSMHAEYTVRGAQAGKHIMCEKPMATSVEDCEKMIDACKKANKKLMIAYRAQYEPYNLKAIEMAREGKLGKLRLITSEHGRHLKPEEPSDKWRAQKKMAGGGSLMDIGIYSLQAARYITGEEPEEVMAMIYSDPKDPRFKEVEDRVNFMLRFPSGVQANLSSGYSYHETKRFSVFGTDARLDLDPATDYYEHNMHVATKDAEEQRKIKEDNQFSLEIDHMSECILENKQPKTPGEEGLRDIRLMMAIYESARKGAPVKV